MARVIVCADTGERCITYEQYLRSEHWKRKRAEYFASGRATSCVQCGSRRVQLHHRTYARVGNENLDDLEPLCDKHHHEAHGWTVDEAGVIHLPPERARRKRGRRNRLFTRINVTKLKGYRGRDPRTIDDCLSDWMRAAKPRRVAAAGNSEAPTR